jgi:hypothetical protein
MCYRYDDVVASYSGGHASVPDLDASCTEELEEELLPY